MEGIMIKF